MLFLLIKNILVLVCSCFTSFLFVLMVQIIISIFLFCYGDINQYLSALKSSLARSLFFDRLTALTDTFLWNAWLALCLKLSWTDFFLIPGRTLNIPIAIGLTLSYKTELFMELYWHFLISHCLNSVTVGLSPS